MNKIENGRAFDAALENGRLVVADFYADWCGPCKAQSPVLESLSEQLAGSVDFVKINVDEHPELAQRFLISSIPTLIFFQGKSPVDRTVGMQSEAALKQKIAALAVNHH